MMIIFPIIFQEIFVISRDRDSDQHADISIIATTTNTTKPL